MSSAPQELFASAAILAALPDSKDPPEWVTLFPSLGAVKTVDGREYVVDAQALIESFNAGGIDVAFDINHATEIKAPKGEDAPAVAWAKELRVEGGSLQARVEWLPLGAAVVTRKKYRYVSPSFWHTKDGRTTRLKSVALTNSPALLNQPALAHATNPKEEVMPEVAKLAAAIGVVATANEEAMLAALAANFVPKADHEAALLAAEQVGDKATADLAAANDKLAKIEADARKAKIDGLIESALAAKKILPAEKDHYASLCASDAGFESVSKLFSAKGVVLKESGLDKKAPPEGNGGTEMTAAQLAAKATKMVENGDAADYISAVSILSQQQAA